jgi:DNA invertase Pin-like site-specific DNA recombinase
MKILYTRVSTVEQKEDRQVQDTIGFDYVFVDKCSGLIPLWERPKGRELKRLIEQGKLKQITVHSIERLGRSTLNVLQVWKELTELGIVVECRNPNLRNINEDGKPDMFSELMISILSTMASFEKQMIKERQMEGVRIAKAKGVYTGRAVNTKETPEKFLDKPKNKKIVEYLSSGYTQNEISKILNCSFSTINKVIRYKRVVYGPDAYENRIQ